MECWGTNPILHHKSQPGHVDWVTEPNSGSSYREIGFLAMHFLHNQNQATTAMGIDTNTATIINSVDPFPRSGDISANCSMKFILRLFPSGVLWYRHHPNASVPRGADEHSILFV
jgi:hypothetical protein